jgi:hypothetical protein
MLATGGGSRRLRVEAGRGDNENVRVSSVAAGNIGHLTIVAGPTAVGKSHFINLLASDDLLRERFGISSDALVSTARSIGRNPPTEDVDHLVLHYDIMRPFSRNEKPYEQDLPMPLLGRAGTSTFLTLRAPEERLRAQLDARQAEDTRQQEHFRALRRLYEDEPSLIAWYDRWLRFVQQHSGARSYLVHVHQNYAVTPVAEQPVQPRRLRVAAGAPG